MRLNFTKREGLVVLDALTRLSALSAEEMEEVLDWGPAEVQAWGEALGKLERAHEVLAPRRAG